MSSRVDTAARVSDAVVGIASLAFVMLCWVQDPTFPVAQAITMASWCCLWSVPFLLARPRRGYAWAARFVLATAYFAWAGCVWFSSRGETRAYLVLGGMPFLVLTLYYAVLFGFAARHSRITTRREFTA